MRRTYLVVLALLLVLAGLSMAAKSAPELPEWFIVLLGVLLPFVFQTFICRLPAWLKPVVSYGLAGAIAVGCGFAFAGWRSILDVVRNLAWLYATVQFVYDIMVRPLWRTLKTKAAERRRAAEKLLE